MEWDILNQPIRFKLYGLSSKVENQQYGTVGMQLMNEMWSIVKQANIRTTGINHWVYPSGNQVFVGVEVENPQGVKLEPLEFVLTRYLRHVHVGPYEALPQKWQAIKAELAARGESMAGYSLEVYGHHSDDPAKTETTILIGLAVANRATSA